MPEKACTKCGVTKSLDVFGPEPRMRDGRASWCRECHAADQNARRLLDPEKYRAQVRLAARRRRELKPDEVSAYRMKYYRANRDRQLARDRFRKYGVSPEDYELLMATQHGCCALCGASAEANGRALSIDHCHATGQVRKLLCTNCNNGLGSFKDDPALLRAAAAYVEEALVEAEGTSAL